MGRSRGRFKGLLRMGFLGLITLPAVAGLAFGALVLTSEATGTPAAPELRDFLWTALRRSGFRLPSPTPTTKVAAPDPTASAPPPTTIDEAPQESYVFDPGAALRFTLTPSATPTATDTASASPTPSATVTASIPPSTTPTPTPTFKSAATPTWPPPTEPPDTATAISPTATETGPTATAMPSDPTATGSAPATAGPTATAAGDCSTSLNSNYENQILDLVNGARSDEGLQDLTLQSQLRTAARIHAADMACNHFTSHTGSDGSSVRDRVEAQGYNWSWIGENYMVTRSGPQHAFDWWMSSTPHRNNILGPNYTEIGVGYIYGTDSDYGGYFVLVFARPG